MFNFGIKVSQRYFIWPVLCLWGLPYRWLKNSPAEQTIIPAENCTVSRPVLCHWTVDPRKLLVHWTLSLRRVLIKGQVRAKSPWTVLFRQTLQQTVLYLWCTSEAWYQSTGLFESLVQYSSLAKYRPNEVLLGDFKFKNKHENVIIN